MNAGLPLSPDETLAFITRASWIQDILEDNRNSTVFVSLLISPVLTKAKHVTTVPISSKKTGAPRTIGKRRKMERPTQEPTLRNNTTQGKAVSRPTRPVTRPRKKRPPKGNRVCAKIRVTIELSNTALCAPQISRK